MKYLVKIENQKKLILLKDSSIVAELNYKNGFNYSNLSMNNKNEILFTIEKTSIWKSDYILIDERNSTLCKVTRTFTWKNWKTYYNRNENEIILSKEHSEILYLSIIHSLIILNNNALAA